MSHDSAGSADHSDAPRLAAGDRVGDKYVITQLLGVGANGAVYGATHEEIGHRVAIKVVHQALATRDDIIERFRREAKVCGTIRDRHVGQVYDVGQLLDGAPYMVMELHEGKPIEALLKQKTLPIATVIDLGRQLLAGLAAAHACDVVHRDVKPANLMLTRESNGSYLLKLVDFGISKRITRDISERNVTVEGTVVGSPDYMPPEQLRGGDVDRRADIYATGVVLYEAITGRMPFDAGSMTELLAAILRDPVAPPRSLRPDCPAELEQVVIRAMSRSRADRFETANEMSNALGRIVHALQLPEGTKAWDVDSFPAAGSQARVVGLSKTTSGGDYSIETERVRTVELQLPKQKAWPIVVGGGAVIVVSVVIALASGSTEKATSVRTAELPAAVTTTAAHPAADPAIDLNPAEPTTPSLDVEIAHDPVEEEPAAAPVAAEGPSASSRSSSRRASNDRRAPRAAAAPTPPPVDVSGLVSQASSAFVQGQLPKALALYQQAVAAAPSHAAAWRGLGMTAMKMGRGNDARKAFERYLKLAPTAPDAARIREKLNEL
jgi:serine/threonine-protein kinase